MPAFNEVGTVRILLERVMAVPMRKQVIVVDDGSTDGTREVLEEFRATHGSDPDSQLVLMFHERNQGKGAAVRTAIPAIIGDIALIQDADLEYDPSDYAKLIQPIVEGHADAVFGSRFSGSPRRVLFFWHAVANRILTLVSNAFTNLNLTDMETCYKAFRADILKSIPIRSNRFGIEPELTAKASRMHCRIYEVPISYHGRNYSEGKKIGWTDAVAALWTILRFAVVADLGRTDAGFTTLRRVEGLERYTAFLWELMRPYVGRRVLEVGAGTGIMTRYLSTRERLVTTDLDSEYVALLQRRFGDNPKVEVRQLDLGRVAESGLPAGAFDTVVCSNVLEHVENDRDALEALRKLLVPGGHVILVVPAVHALYGSIDRALGHFRRYTRPEIAAVVSDAGLRLEHVSYFNLPGVPGWYLNSRVLKRRTIPRFQAGLNDLLVPMLRLERRLQLPLGMSLLAVGRND